MAGAALQACKLGKRDHVHANLARKSGVEARADVAGGAMAPGSRDCGCGCWGAELGGCAIIAADIEAICKIPDHQHYP